MSRIIQVPMDEELVGKLDALSEKQSQSRATVIREACRKYVTEERRRQMDDEYEAGYRRIPETTEMGEAQLAMLGEVLEPEDFSDWYDK